MSSCSCAISAAWRCASLDVALAARGLVALQLPLRLAQPIGGRRGLAGRRRIALRRGAAHRIGGVAQLPRGVGEVLAILIARQLFELARRFFGLLGQRALQVAAVAAGRLARGHAALPLDFLLLPARELLQLLGELVDLLILLLRRGLRVGLVLVRHLVHFHLEQVGEIVRDRSRAAAATAAAGLAAGLHLQLELFFGLLQELQRACSRAAARRPELCACSFFSAAVICSAAFGSSSAIFLNDGSDTTRRLFMRSTRPFDLIAQLALRQRQHHHALAELRRGRRSCDRAGC